MDERRSEAAMAPAGMHYGSEVLKVDARVPGVWAEISNLDEMLNELDGVGAALRDKLSSVLLPIDQAVELRAREGASPTTSLAQDLSSRVERLEALTEHLRATLHFVDL